MSIRVYSWFPKKSVPISVNQWLNPSPSISIPIAISITNLFLLFLPLSAHAILAGGEFDLPTDYPSNRLDPRTTDSPFNAVGALRIDNGSSTYSGSAIALSRNWVFGMRTVA